MIKYREGEFLDFLPSFLTENEDYAAISYAFKMAIGVLSNAQDLTWLYSSIDTMPDDILDLMALELKAPYYSEDLGIDVRRILVKKAMLWRFKAGTKASVEEMVTTVFGEGKVKEWFEYEPERTPGTFGIETDAILTPQIFSDLARTIEYVKNETSHLDEISVKRQTEGKVRAGTHTRSAYTHEVPINDKVDRAYAENGAVRAATCEVHSYRGCILDVAERIESVSNVYGAHQALRSWSRQTVQ